MNRPTAQRLTPRAPVAGASGGARTGLLHPAMMLVLAMVAGCSGATAPTPGGVDASLRRRGGAATIEALVRTGQWDGVADHLGSGDARWIALAPRLGQAADAGVAEELGIALAFSLPKNPRAVLAALDADEGRVLGADRVCGMPFIEDTVKDRPGYRSRALQAVSSVSDPALGRARTACLLRLRQAS